MSQLNGKTASVLVVEDNKDLNLAICEILRSYGYLIQSAMDGKDALDTLRTTPPDVILCDIMMPKMDGYTLLKHTRADPKFRTLPFIFLTARTGSDDQRRAKGIGIEDYLTKPVEEPDLVLAIQNALRRRQNVEEELAQHMDALRNQIVRTLQHEFRTPLTFVLGYAEFLQDLVNELDNDELSTAVKGILEGGHRLHRLIESFLLLANVQNREAKSEELYSLNGVSLLHNAVHDSRTPLEKAGITAKISGQNDDAWLLGEPEFLHESLKRMLDNAARYSRPESQNVWLSIERLDETHVGLRVRDEGKGIPAQLLDKLARPFEQEDRDGRTDPGAGLSVAFMHHVANLHGGRLEIESEEGKGSTFTLWVSAAVEPVGIN